MTYLHFKENRLVEILRTLSSSCCGDSVLLTSFRQMLYYNCLLQKSRKTKDRSLLSLLTVTLMQSRTSYHHKKSTRIRFWRHIVLTLKFLTKMRQNAFHSSFIFAFNHGSEYFFFVWSIGKLSFNLRGRKKIQSPRREKSFDLTVIVNVKNGCCEQETDIYTYIASRLPVSKRLNRWALVRLIVTYTF